MAKTHCGTLLRGSQVQCKCGGITVDREQVEKKKVVCRYAECRACGRVHVWWREGGVDDIMPNHKMIGADMMPDDATPRH